MTGPLGTFPLELQSLRSVICAHTSCLYYWQARGKARGWAWLPVGQFGGGAEGRRAPMGGDSASFDPNFMGTIDFRGVTRDRKWELC